MKTNHCLNCGHQLLETKDFCPSCGQKSKEAVLTVKQLLSDIFKDVFNFDSSFIKTFKDLLIPAKLTKAYAAGKRKSYFAPVKFFLITMFLHFTLLVFLLDPGIGISRKSAQQYIEKAALLEKYDQLTDQYLSSEECDAIDSVRLKMFEHTKYLSQDTFPSQNNDVGFIPFITDLRKYGIMMDDAYKLDHDSLFNKYHVESKIDRIKITQYIKFEANRLSGIKYLISNLAWSILASLLLSALLLKLIYVRHHIYFVEHTVLQMNFHSFGFILVSLMLLIDFTFDNEDLFDSMMAVIPILIILYAFLSFKKYYCQGWWMTLFKFLIYGFSYFLLLMSSSLIISFISIFLF